VEVIFIKVTNKTGFVSGGKIRTKKTLTIKRFQKFNTHRRLICQKIFFKTGFLLLNISELKTSVVWLAKTESGKIA
jgi:hypothetical protein